MCSPFWRIFHLWPDSQKNINNRLGTNRVIFTHPLSDALTIYCLSEQALAFDRQVMEAVWPNNMALGQIWEKWNTKTIQAASGDEWPQITTAAGLAKVWLCKTPCQNFTSAPLGTRGVKNPKHPTINDTMWYFTTSSSDVRSQRQICPSWQPVMIVLKSSITNRLLIQWVGAVRPHRTMGRTRLFPDIVLIFLVGLNSN